MTPEPELIAKSALPSHEERTPLLRSLRLKAWVVILGVFAMPPLLVMVWASVEGDIETSVRANTMHAAEQVTREVLSTPSEVAAAEPETPQPASTHVKLPPPRQDTRTQVDWPELYEVARNHVVRIRLFDRQGRPLVDADLDHGTDVIHKVGTMLIGPDGAPTLQAFDDSLGPVEERPEFETARAGSPAAGCRRSPDAKLLVCHAVLTGVHNGEPVVVYVQESSRRAVRALYDLRYQLARLSLIMLPIALILAWWMGKQIVRPIEVLRGAALAKASSANPRGELVVRRRDETADLAAAFNVLLCKLDERRGENERFVADLVHEFKNPVAAVRACAESLEGGTVDSVRAARLARVLTDASARLNDLVSQFLELARAEAGMPREGRSEVDLCALASGVVTAVKAQHPEVEFAIDAPAHALVNAVEPRMESVLRNLIDNAAIFAGLAASSEHPAKVWVSVRTAQGHVEVRVEDNGPGIEEKDLPHVFDRFFTTRGRESGSGLGLALAQAVVQAHQGSISVSSETGNGAKFTLTLPTACH
jgi:signal transduction histidine kinase